MKGFSTCQERLRELLQEISDNRDRCFFLGNEIELLRRCGKAAHNITEYEEKIIILIHARIRR
jgi:hypothetical protein